MTNAVHAMAILAVLIPILNGKNGFSFLASALLAAIIAGGFAAMEHFNPQILRVSRGSSAFRVVTPIAFMLNITLLGILTLVMRWL